MLVVMGHAVNQRFLRPKIAGELDGKGVLHILRMLAQNLEGRKIEAPASRSETPTTASRLRLPGTHRASNARRATHNAKYSARKDKDMQLGPHRSAALALGSQLCTCAPQTLKAPGSSGLGNLAQHTHVWPNMRPVPFAVA